MADLVQKMEGDNTDSKSEKTSTETIFGDSKNKVTKLYALVSSSENNTDTRNDSQVGFVESIEVADEKIYLSKLAAAMKVNYRSATGFRLGYVEN